MWKIGIDEAGYGPNLGPFVMTSVACRVPDHSRDANLWQLLHPAVRQGADGDDGRLLIDDSKIVYTSRGLAGLERGVLATMRHNGAGPATSLAEFVDWICPDDCAELRREAWYRGTQTIPLHGEADDRKTWTERFEEVCNEANVGPWHVRAVVVCPPRFNSLLDGGKKGVVLSHALTHLLRWQHANLTGDDALSFHIDKHGGRNFYAAMIQDALPDGMVFTGTEGMMRSVYRVHGLGREVGLMFQPRADAEHFCVALASMISKYLREVLMVEFNGFWREHVPDVKATAGYPGDAARFLQAIREAIRKLGLREEDLWRRK
jgi:ribonuclease HII